MNINPLFSNQLPYNKIPSSLSNTEILGDEQFNCKLCLAIVFNSYDWLKSFNTKMHLLKMEF